LNEEVKKINIHNILPNPYQPASRMNVSEATAKRFWDSICEHGLLQIPVCRLNRSRNKMEMGDGWLRLAGYRYGHSHGHPECIEMPIIIRDMTDKQMADLVMEANTVRQDLNPIELAEFYEKYLADFNLTQQDLAQTYQISQGEISNTMRLLKLPEEVRALIISREISPKHGICLLQLKDEKLIKELARQAAGMGLSAAELEVRVREKLGRPPKEEKEPATPPDQRTILKDADEESFTLNMARADESKEEAAGKVTEDESGCLSHDCGDCKYCNPDKAKRGQFSCEAPKGTGFTPKDIIPAGVREAHLVPKEECRNCALSTCDHTLGLKFEQPEGTFHKVCILDYIRVVDRDAADNFDKLGHWRPKHGPNSAPGSPSPAPGGAVAGGESAAPARPHGPGAVAPAGARETQTGADETGGNAKAAVPAHHKEQEKPAAAEKKPAGDNDDIPIPVLEKANVRWSREDVIRQVERARRAFDPARDFIFEAYREMLKVADIPGQPDYMDSRLSYGIDDLAGMESRLDCALDSILNDIPGCPRQPYNHGRDRRYEEARREYSKKQAKKWKAKAEKANAH